MSIQELGSLGELLGSIVVLVTLVYLAIQTRHARTANEANIQWQRANASRDLAVMWATSPEAVELLAEFGQPDSKIPDNTEFNDRYFRYAKINQSILEMLQANLLTALTKEDREIRVTPNKAMKRTSLPVTSFACAKESPDGVGRLSRR
jgi:hypothetical protein